MRKTIWIIDDELDLLELWEVLSRRFKRNDFEFKFVEHFKECIPNAGDVVVHDLKGVGEKVELEGVKYFSMSGDVFKEIDFPKPFCTTDFFSTLVSSI